MKYIFSLFLCLLFNTNSYSQWVNINSGINDNLTGLVFLDENGLASGADGLYYTSSGGVGVGSWTRFEITNNAQNAAIYENTVFTHCFSRGDNTSNTGSVYACGQDVVTNKAVLFKISLPSLAYEIKYVGPVNSKLNKIDYSSTISRYVAVGDNGLILTFSDTALTSLNSGLTEDLLSVNMSSVNILMGSDQKLFKGSLSINFITNVVEIPTPNVINKDVSLSSAFNLYALGTNSFSYTDLSVTNYTTRYNQNFYGPLDANGVKLYSNNFYIGTDNGIYRCSYATASTFQNISIEWQTSSLDYQINDFWKQDGTTDFYAFGNNGVILKTTSNGGATKPYVKINYNGGCYPGVAQLSAITGSASSYSWFVNGNLVNNSSNNFNYNFPAAGVYNLSLTVQNNEGEQSTDTKVVHLVNPPQIDKVVTLSDAILCKEEVTQIEIIDSEPNVIYTLKREGQPNSNFGNSPISSGGNLQFDTSLIDVTGNYYIEAKSSLANCSRRFTGNFLITVEETKANFHCGLINAEVNELVNFYENAIDSQNFEWQFAPSSSTSTSALSNPQVSFSAPGQMATTLHSWSNNFCHDIVIENKPFVVEPPLDSDNCILLTNNSNDPQWPGSYNPDISQMIPTSDGFLTCGTYFNEVFDSNLGTNFSLANKKGGYLSKYDHNGVLKWVVYNINTSFGNVNDNVIYSTAVDSNDNIYISGKGVGEFIDNTGRNINLSATIYLPDFYIIKLNSKGELIWYSQISNLGFIKIAVDQDDNLIAISDFRTSFTTIPIYFNGVFIQEIGQQVISPQATNLIVKFSPVGNVIWDTKVYLNSANNREFRDFGIDATNNIYVTMAFDSQARVYQAGSNTISQTIFGDGSSGSKIGIFKLNSDGVIQWKLRSRTIDNNGFPSDTTIANRMIVDADGTIYITGSNNTGDNYLGTLNYTHVFENTDATTVSTNKGPYFVAKISTDGICQWIRGSGHTYYGEGYNLLKSGGEIYVVGQISNNNVDNCTALFDSTDSNGYNLTINRYDYFISVYDEVGNLKRLYLNNDGGNFNFFYGFNGFFKGNGDNFYLSKNMGYPNSTSTQPYIDFGMTMPSFNGVDGTVVRYTEACAIPRYSSNLNDTDWSNNAFQNLVVFPNPTENNFSIELNTTYENIILVIYDVTGKVITEEKFNNVTKVTSSIDGQSGLYFVLLKTQNGQKWFKLIKS